MELTVALFGEPDAIDDLGKFAPRDSMWIIRSDADERIKISRAVDSSNASARLRDDPPPRAAVRLSRQIQVSQRPVSPESRRPESFCWKYRPWTSRRVELRSDRLITATNLRRNIRRGDSEPIYALGKRLGTRLHQRPRLFKA